MGIWNICTLLLGGKGSYMGTYNKQWSEQILTGMKVWVSRDILEGQLGLVWAGLEAIGCVQIGLFYIP